MGGVCLYYTAAAHCANSKVIPMTALAIAGVNYFTYCSPVMMGTVCLHRFDPLVWWVEGRGQVWEMLGGASMIVIPIFACICIGLDALATAKKGLYET